MIFAAAAVLIIAVLVFTLLIRQKDLPQPEPVPPTLHLDERKKAIYENLRDLQFEYRMGKLSDQDYSESKLDLQRQLAVVLAEIEKINARMEKATAAPQVSPVAGSAGAPSAAPAAAKTPPAVAKAPPAAANAPPACVCPRCSTEFAQPMKYCGECGQAIPATS